MIYTGGDGDDKMMGMGQEWGQSDGNGKGMGTNQWGWVGDGGSTNWDGVGTGKE